MAQPCSLTPEKENQHTGVAECGSRGVALKYVDASVVLGLLFGEKRSVWIPRDDEPVVSSVLLEVESHRAIERERLLGNLTDSESARKMKELSEVLQILDLAPLDDSVIRLARQAFGVNVRALDALHVATAQVLAAESRNERLVFLTYDERQAVAARARGLDVQSA